MARIRTVKPSFWGDSKVAPLSVEARYLMLGLVSFADDAGRFLASPTAVLGYVFPHDEIPPAKLRKWITEISRQGLAIFYEDHGLRYGQLIGFTKHQRISHPQPSTLPPPPNSSHARGIVPQQSAEQAGIDSAGEWKGREEEWKGRDKDVSSSFDSSSSESDARPEGDDESQRLNALINSIEIGRL